MKLYKVLIPALFAVLLISCSDDEVASPLMKHVVKFSMDDILNPHTVVENANAHSGKRICHVDSGSNFGFGYSFSIPDSLVGKAINVDVDAWVKTGKLENKCDIVVSVTDDKEAILLWTGLNAKESIVSPNEWTRVVKTIGLSQELLSKNNLKINVIAHNLDAISYFDIDDLIITYSEPNNTNP